MTPRTAFSRRLAHALERLRGEPVDRRIRELRACLAQVEALGPELERASDPELRARADRLRRNPAAAAAIALVREVGRRTLGLRLHDAQVLAAAGLCAGRVVELATGEGKTLAAVAAVWLGALAGRGVHVLTFSDYLARRDAAWMGPIYAFLGTSVGCIQEDQQREQRRRAYACDVTYATAKQAGFDYLRDQLALDRAERVHRPFHLAIVDEADSLLIDEARVPLVLAGGSGPLPVDPQRMAALARRFEREREFELDEHGRNVLLTERGVERAERELGIDNLHDAARRHELTALNLALHAEVLLRRDVDYLVRDGRIEVVDEFTGRVVPDRRWPNGLHPALEAKEGLEVRPEGTVLASLPLQHLIRLYPQRAGMTATAVPAREELAAFYGLEVAVIPPHRPCVRSDEPDAVFADRAGKRRALLEELRRLHALGRPVLVGTASVAESEALAAELETAGLSCRVLNARHDEDEARRIAEAGRRGQITISTNMAGRGVDIRLGAEVAALGGLAVLGTAKHESRRVDDQLRGRAGRQGDPGSSRFYLSLEDDLIVRYGIAAALAGVPAEDAGAEIERAQRIVDGQNLEIRRTLWNYSALVEQQRQILAELRERTLDDASSADVFARRSPERHAQLLERFGAARTAALEQRLALIEIDRGWSAHLARLADVRENIHLFHLAGTDWFGGLWGLRKTPLDVFHEMAVRAFDETLAQIEDRAVAAFDALELTERGLDLERAGLRGPASTWTYLVSDTPFESTIIRMVRGVVRELRG